MKLLIHTLVFCRLILLNRHMRKIRRRIQDMPVSTRRTVGEITMEEIDAASRTPVPHLYGSSSSDIYQPWGDGATLAFRRTHARAAQLQLRGMAMWLAIVFHETRESPHAGMQAFHRETLGLLGLLKGTYENATGTRIHATN